LTDPRLRRWPRLSSLLASTALALPAPAAAGTINNTGTFNINSTAGNNTYNNFPPNGLIRFRLNATGATAIINNSSRVEFHDFSTGANSVITNSNSLGGTTFSTSFQDNSTAGNATIITSAGGTTFFLHNATGGNAQLTANAGGIVDFSGTSGPAGDNQITAGSIAGAGTFLLGQNQLSVGSNDLSTTVSGTIQDGGASGGTGGALVKVGTGTLTLAGANSYTGGTTINAGTLQLGDGGASGSIVGDVVNNGTFAINRSDVFTFDGVISEAGAFQQNGSGTTILTAANSYIGGTTINAGTLQLGNGGTSGSILGNVLNQTIFAINRSDTYTFGGRIVGDGSFVQIGPRTTILTADNSYIGGTTISAGTLQLGNGGTSGSIVGNVTDNGALVVNRSGTITLPGVISGTGSLSQIGPGTTILTGNNTYGGGTTINAGTLQLGNGGTSGSIIGNVVNNGVFAINRSDAFTVGNFISGTGAFQQNGSGTTILTATNTYSGATTVNAGALVVNGSIANSAVTVASGALLAGSGTVGATTVNSGGILAPGLIGTPGTMAVAGNLAFQSGALYLVQVNAANGSAANVTTAGGAALAGTVNAAFAAASYATHTFTILSAAGGLGGTRFGSLTTGNLPAGFTANLSYTDTNVILNLTATLGAFGAGSLSGNQASVANALNNFFNNGGALPPAFVTIFGLTGGDLGDALSQLSGEAASGGQQAGFQMTSQFLGLMLDPFIEGRSGVAGTSGPALGFAPEREALPDDIALAYSSVLKAPKAPSTASFKQRWSVWGSAYGGSNRTSGDPAVAGSHDLNARTAGFAGGLDYRLTPNSLVGFALAGGGTNWSLSQGLGSGKSDAFQAGIYGVTRSGPAYLAAALAYTNHWMSTDRFAFAGDHLTASFNAQSFGARVEGGYRFGVPLGGVTPYAAIQAQNFRTPSYSETDTNGGGFALAYAARTATDTRSELGARFDRLLAFDPGAALALRARLAWAHDWVSDPALAAVFQTLPGASFIVNGATPAKNSALASAGAELRLANGVTLLGKFDGEFAAHSSTYAGTGTIRYAW
jgi:outer membrane autotransporter protein